MAGRPPYRRPDVEAAFADLRLGLDLEAWVRRQRSDDRSWRWIADRLHELVDQTVTGETLRTWYPDENAA